jgi:L-fuculose-phosphate aldolase
VTNLHQIKLEICDIGRRIYAKGFAAGNDGNISYRLGPNEVLCTPTMVCKGFLKPEDLCTVDVEGKQLSGRRKRTSEILLHLAIMKKRPEVKSVVHCHPPHATAFAVAREPIPQCVLPEVEVFLGDVPITKYETPGGQHFADTVLPFVEKTNVIILANHGTVSYGETVERAYWWTEILDAYCRILMLAKDLGRIHYFSEAKERELLELKTKWGYKDARLAPDMENCDICANDVFRASWRESDIERRAFEAPPPMRPTGGSGKTANPPTGVDQEQLIRTITERVMAALANK